MKILILGATGSIGSAVTRELITAGHAVVALSRSATADTKLARWGAEPLRGDLRHPEGWVDAVARCDGIIHAAATFTDDMGAVDARVVAALEEAAATRSGQRPRFLYTGGCWLYGETGDGIATERRGFNPLPAFSWMVANGNRLLRSAQFSTAIIHPAMVYHAEGGVFARYLAAVREKRPIEIWGAPTVRWPLVHRDDLAAAYRLLLERPDLTGHFNASAQTGIEVGYIAQAMSDHFGSPGRPIIRPVEDVTAEYGDWAKGPTLDQRMSSQKLRDACGWQPKHPRFEQSDLFS